MEQLSNIESIYVQNATMEHRKQYAQFFTPLAIAQLMADWLLGNDKMETVLEPAFGLGVFSRILLSVKSNLLIKGFDIDEIILNEAKKHFEGYKSVTLMLQDYMFNDWNNKYDGIICNPPYFKFHDYDNKSVISEIERKLSCKLNGFTNLYTLFLLKSIHQLKNNGRCAYIVPSEFMNSDYGKLVKSHLLKTKTLRHIIVFDFDENVFDDAITTACIILCAKDVYNEIVQFTNVTSSDGLDVIGELINNYPNTCEKSQKYRIDNLDYEIKWKNYYQNSNILNFKGLVPFSKYAKVVRGIATGANDFFTFNISKAKEYNIPTCNLLPCICRCADVKGYEFSEEDFDALKKQDKKVFLLNAATDNNPNVMQYLEMGKSMGIDKKFLTASRNPWYALEKRPPSPIWVSVFNRKGLRFIRNRANISNLTTFHCVYPQKDLFSNISIDLLFAYLLTDTARIIFERNAREYGNGLQKFEPNDLNKGMMLDLVKISSEHKSEIVSYYEEFVKTNDNSWIGKIDEILLMEFSC